ncbi:uncharacterized protein isoform X3 [Musca autumnalis]|uniref:uncharacterized protein isoform X3 n=1 Tax=Musca autumnalis TaxID=221902 RepID=UPI003CFB70D6
MAPPVRRSPPTLRSIASADTITSDQPDHEAQVDVSSEAYGNTQATPRTETNNQTMSSAVHSGTKKPASNNCASDNNAITETPKGNVSSQKKTVSKSGNAMKATEPGTSSQQREVDNIADIKKQMAYLKRQLLETKSQLAESQRQCQQLEVMSQKPSRETVSDHNLNSENMSAIDLANTTTTTMPPNIQATHTSTSTAAIMTQPPPAADVNVVQMPTQPATNNFNQGFGVGVGVYESESSNFAGVGV